MKQILYFILILFVFPTLHAQEVKVATSTKNIKIGEQIEYKISVQAPADAVVVFPEGQTFGALEMVKTNPTDTLKEAGKFLNSTRVNTPSHNKKYRLAIKIFILIHYS